MLLGGKMKPIWDWMQERFPPLTLFTSALLVALVASTLRFMQHGHPFWKVSDALVALAVWCQFLLLRVLDEHKDFKDDARFHPERVLQRGVIGLGTLKILGAVACLITLLVTLVVSRGSVLALGAWAVVEVWTFLMTVEFFAPRFLRSRIGLYSASHMLVLPLMVMWISTLTASSAQPFSFGLAVLMTFAYINGLIYEVARKTKGREEEKPDEPTFTRLWGVSTSARALNVLMLLSFVLFALFGLADLSFNWLGLLPTAAFMILSVLSVQKFTQGPSRKARQRVEGITALYVLAAYITCITFAQLG
jgi:4-hydroxybenzoate polyprenyltransferase